MNKKKRIALSLCLIGCLFIGSHINFTLATDRNAYGQVTWVGPLENHFLHETYNGNMSPFDKNGLAVAGKDGKKGLLDTGGNFIVPPTYTLIIPADGPYYLAVQAEIDALGFLDKTGKIQVPLDYCDFGFPSDGMIFAAKYDAAKNMKYGYIDINNKVLIPFLYDSARAFREQRGWVGQKDAKGNMKYGCIDESGNLCIAFQYDEAADFLDGLARVGLADGGEMKYGLINTAGEVILPLEYSSLPATLEGYDNDLIPASKDKKSGYLGTDGQVVIPFLYDSVEDFRGEIAQVGVLDSNGIMKYGYIDTTGKEKIPPIYDRSEEFKSYYSEGLCPVGQNGKFGYISESGAVEIPFIYDDASVFSDGLAAVRRGAFMGYIDKSGKVIVPIQYDYLSPVWHNSAFVDGRAEVSQNGRYGYINQAGQEVIPLLYSSFITIDDDLILTNLDGKNGILNRAGEVIIPFQYTSIDHTFSEETLVITTGDSVPQRYGYLLRRGTALECLPTEFDVAQPFSNGFAWVKEGDNYGILKNPLLADTSSPWAAQELTTARAQGLTTEATDSYVTYHITRLQFAELAVNLVEKLTGQEIQPAAQSPFSDTDERAARKAAAAGIVSGTGDGSTFSPGRYLNREQLATMLYRAIRYAEEQTGRRILTAVGGLSAYADSGDVSAWAADALGALAASGVMKGTSGTALSPQANTTVEQAILFVLRAYQAV